MADGSSYRELKALRAELLMPFSDLDIENGWNSISQTRVVNQINEVIKQYEDGQLDILEFLILRWLDHDGICEGELVQRIAEVWFSLR